MTKSIEVRSEAGVIILNGYMLDPREARELARQLLEAAEKAQAHLSSNHAGMPGDRDTLAEMTRKGLA